MRPLLLSTVIQFLSLEPWMLSFSRKTGGLQVAPPSLETFVAIPECVPPPVESSKTSELA